MWIRNDDMFPGGIDFAKHRNSPGSISFCNVDFEKSKASGAARELDVVFEESLASQVHKRGFKLNNCDTN